MILRDAERPRRKPDHLVEIGARMPRELAPASSPASSIVLYIALVIAIASQAILALAFGALPGSHRADIRVTIAMCLLLSAPTAGLIWAVWRFQMTTATGTTLMAISVAGLAMRLPFFGAGPMLEDDHFRYLLDGAMVARGLNPYAYAPDMLLNEAVPEAYRSVAIARRQAIDQINFPDLRSIYPGTAQAIFALAHMIKPWGIDGLRVVMLFSEAMTTLLVFRLLTELKRPTQFVALVWCNPLLAFSVTGQVHVDAAIVPLVLVAFVAAQRSAGLSAGVALGLAVGVKLWPVLLGPIFLRALKNSRRDLLRFVMAAGTVTLVACSGLALAALGPNAGVVAYARGWSINNLPYAWLSYAGYFLVGSSAIEPYLRTVIVAAAAGVSVSLAVRPINDTSDLIRRAMIVSAAAFYLSPSQFPWYASWFLALAVLCSNWPLISASASLPAYFLFFWLADTGSNDLFRYWLSGLHVLPVVVLALMTCIDWRRASTR